jgi:hypothetical protein
MTVDIMPLNANFKQGTFLDTATHFRYDPRLGPVGGEKSGFDGVAVLSG